MKSSASRSCRSSKQTRGNTGTVNQRKKIYKLLETLGWDKPARVNGLCKKMFGVDCLEWLSYQQCSKLIEALKSMTERKEKQEDERLQADNGNEEWKDTDSNGKGRDAGAG